ncbi:hypothetical protein [Umezawaea beigongshangensis]|nr:hypothetical protein [Umezawaea beigongshangensis]
MQTPVGGVFPEHPCVVAECHRALDAAALGVSDSRAFPLAPV